MEILKSLMFTACMCAVLSAGVQMLTPQKMKKEMALICTLVLILSAAAGLSKSRIRALDDLLSSGDRRVTRLEYEASVLEQTRKSIEDRLIKALHDKDIFPEKLVIECSLDEYNYVRAERAVIYLSPNMSLSGEAALAEQAAAEFLPDCRIEVIVNE